jgi:type IV pilus assembly protein PilB
MEDVEKKISGSVIIAPTVTDDVTSSVVTIADFKNRVEQYSTENTTNLLDFILFGAIHLEASDIHIEPQEKQARLRLRIDGILQDVCFFAPNVYHHLISRLKLLSKLKLNIQDKPQDGRFTIAIKEHLIEIRTSILPAEYGESVVMRILNPENLTLETLGLREDLYQIFLKEIKIPNGMIIVTGPTSSGKTTTLYACLMKLQNSEIKIITIEDPIEYHLKGISQTQVAPEKGYDFSDGLRSIVRQNPDVVLVGEVRDAETAKIAFQASLTGHLVFSTLHTNDASGAIPRLIDLGVDPSSIAPSLKMIVGQRLVRKVCKHCSELVKPSTQELHQLHEGLKNVPGDLLPKNWSSRKIPKISPQGCKKCNFIGYKGREGLYEILLVDEHIERMILQNPPVSEIKAAAVKRGMITIYQSGLLEVVRQYTTLKEVGRVIEADTA